MRRVSPLAEEVGPMFRLLLFSMGAVMVTAVDCPRLNAGCGKHGTEVAFVDTPSEAAAQAKKDQKLVFVLHLSGHFEDPKFT
jgi:hypothetical protein